jgi:hypothetical protein
MNYSKLLIFKHKCQNYWRIYWERKSNYGYFFLNLVFLISAWYLAYFIYNKLSDELLIFHYTVDFGIDSIASAQNVFIIPFLATILFIINFKFQLLVSSESLKNDYYHLLAGGNIIFNIIILLSLMSIYLSNFYA